MIVCQMFIIFFLFRFFFFQAEDGIRDLVRSRGLGDVYKRQGQDPAHLLIAWHQQARDGADDQADDDGGDDAHGAVSYTHLTLPTSDLV